MALTPPLKEPGRRPEKDYLAAVHKLVDDIYRIATRELQWSWGELAEAAELSYGTVYRLGMRETQWPEFRTLYRLSKAVNCELALERIENRFRKAA